MPPILRAPENHKPTNPAALSMFSSQMQDYTASVPTRYFVSLSIPRRIRCLLYLFRILSLHSVFPWYVPRQNAA